MSEWSRGWDSISTRVVSWLGRQGFVFCLLVCLLVCLFVCLLVCLSCFAPPGHWQGEPVGMVGEDFGPTQTVCCSIIWMVVDEWICVFVDF